jgi:nucleoside-specific outer membrane channel protein Tsx
MKTRLQALIARLLIMALLWPVPSLVMAEDFFQFSDTSISALTGWGYGLKGDHVSALTLENANIWKGGDFYGFVDYRFQHDHPSNSRSWYGELSPRFSLSKIAGLDFGDHFVKDLLIATTWERGEGGNESFLMGAGVNLDIPGFTFFKTNLYARKDKSLGAGFDDMQFTFAWHYPFSIGRYKFVTNGISDYVFGWGPRARNLHFVPQVRMDVGDLSGKPGKVYLGLEFDYWKNQFGIQNSPQLDTNQFGVSILLRVHL